MDRLDAFSKEADFTVEVDHDVVRALAVPCLLKNGAIGSCQIEKSFDPVSGRPNDRIGGAVHAVRIDPAEAQDGLVYNADRTPIGHYIGGDGQSWSHISIRKGSQASPEDDVSAKDLVHRYAKQTVGAVAAAGYNAPAFLAAPNPFKIPNTFEARSDIGPVQDRIRGKRIAIVGVGGTGAYILDLITKTPVAEIHLLDPDDHDWHNFMRAPGAPTTEEIESQREQPLSKVGYYHAKYSALREGIFAHAIQVDNQPQFAEFFSEHRIDFAFVCIDQRPDGDASRQDVVYAALSEARVPFIDSGVSITLADGAVGGAVTTSAYAEGSLDWHAIPNARVQGGLPGYRNVQLPEVNALAASLAVMEWRRRTGQYVSESSSFLHKFLLEGPAVRTPSE